MFVQGASGVTSERQLYQSTKSWRERKGRNEVPKKDRIFRKTKIVLLCYAVKIALIGFINIPVLFITTGLYLAFKVNNRKISDESLAK